MLTSTHRRERARMAQEYSDGLDAVDCCLSKIKEAMELVNRQSDGLTGEAEDVLFQVWEGLNEQCGKLVGLKSRLETM